MPDPRVVITGGGSGVEGKIEFYNSNNEQTSINEINLKTNPVIKTINLLGQELKKSHKSKMCISIYQNGLVKKNILLNN